MNQTFAKGDRVRLKKATSVLHNLPVDAIFIVGAVQPLRSPNAYYVDPYYWNRSEWSWARGKSRLDVAGHHQVLFLEGILRPKTDIPSMNEDPDGKGRCSFSGAWFEKAA